MGKNDTYPLPSRRRTRKPYTWDAQRIRLLREHLGITQTQMADELQVRQQTISEWEVGIHMPHRSTQKLLSMVAERAGFGYTTNTEQQPEQNEQTTP